MKQNSLDSKPIRHFDLKWGEHACQLYRTREDLLEVLVPYFSEGLRSREYCMWITADSLSVEEARAALNEALPDLASYEAAGQIEILPFHEWYVEPSGTMKKLKELLSAWLARLQISRERGFEGLRVTGNAYFINTPEDWRDFISYEKEVDAVIGEHRLKAICSYCLDKAKEPAEIAEIINSHASTLVKKGREWKWIRSSEHEMLQAVRLQKEKLRILAQELERSNAELTQFAHIASHDLQEPLRTITYFSELLQDQLKDKLDLESVHYLGAIADSSMRARRQVEVLLDYSRLEKSENPLAVVNSEAAVNRATANLTHLIIETKTKIVRSPLPTIIGEEYLLSQLFQNLIANAIKFRSKDASPLIHISAQREEEKWVFCVKDNGIGIAGKYHAKIFQLFQRLHSREDYPGFGIGLALCKKIVERHNGRIWVESEAGSGAAFYFTLSPVHGTPAEFFKKEHSLFMKTSIDRKEDFLKPADRQHIVHFAETLDDLCSTVTAFAGSGLRLGEALVFAALPVHAEAFREEMRKYLSVDEAEIEGQIVFLDAEELLSSFYGPMGLAWEAFRSSVNRTLDKVQERGFANVRIYGEIVHLLWSRGEAEKAVKLEEFWNRLALERKFLLFCGYVMNSLETEKHAASFLKVCRSHQKLITPES